MVWVQEMRPSREHYLYSVARERVVATVSQQETEGTALNVSLANVADLVGEAVITIIQQRFPFGKSKLTHRLFSTHRTGIIARLHRKVTL